MKSPKPCKPDQERNPKTNRCVKKKVIKKKKSLKKSSKRKSRKFLSDPIIRRRSLIKQNRQYVSQPLPSLKNIALSNKCKVGQVFNPKTKRCNKIKKSKKSKRVRKSPTKSKPCKPDQVRNPATGRCVKNKVVKSPRKKANLKISSNDKSNMEVDDELMDHFIGIVDELPFITYEEDIRNGEERYDANMLAEDIINIIIDIHKETGHTVVPDPETMIDIATAKFDNADKKHTKEVNKFIYGTNIGNDSIFDKIRNITRTIEARNENDMETRYKNLNDEDDIAF